MTMSIERANAIRADFRDEQKQIVSTMEAKYPKSFLESRAAKFKHAIATDDRDALNSLMEKQHIMDAVNWDNARFLANEAAKNLHKPLLRLRHARQVAEITKGMIVSPNGLHADHGWYIVL